MPLNHRAAASECFVDKRSAGKTFCRDLVCLRCLPTAFRILKWCAAVLLGPTSIQFPSDSGYKSGMQELHVTEFITLLKKSGLLTPPQQGSVLELAKSLRTPTSPPIESKAFAEILSAELVRREWMTQWQGNQLLKGQTGFILQQYRLLAPVGKGGMGHVFKARDERNGAIVAIKVMSRKLTGNQTLVNRFRREIRASSLLNSPHIVRTLDGGRVGKVDFMVMEYVNGDQLDSVVVRVSSIPVGIACDIIRQAAVGLQHAHEQKMVHRDIKPGNLIVDWSAEGKREPDPED